MCGGTHEREATSLFYDSGDPSRCERSCPCTSRGRRRGSRRRGRRSGNRKCGDSRHVVRKRCRCSRRRQYRPGHRTATGRRSDQRFGWYGHQPEWAAPIGKFRATAALRIIRRRLKRRGVWRINRHSVDESRSASDSRPNNSATGPNKSLARGLLARRGQKPRRWLSQRGAAADGRLERIARRGREHCGIAAAAADDGQPLSDLLADALISLDCG